MPKPSVMKLREEEGRVQSLHFRVKDAREKDTQTIAEVTFEVSLTPTLAARVIENMPDDLYIEGKNGRRAVKEDVREIEYDLPSAAYLIEVRSRPDIQKHLRLSGVTVRKLSAYKNAEGDGFNLGFTLSFLLLDPEEALLFVKHLRKPLWLTFAEQQPVLPDLTEGAAGQDVDVAADGTAAARKSKSGETVN